MPFMSWSHGAVSRLQNGKKRSWRTDRREAARKTKPLEVNKRMMLPGHDLQHLMEQYTLSRRFARRFPRVQLRVAYPGSDHRTWNGMEKKERMFRCFSAKCALALGQQAAWISFTIFLFVPMAIVCQQKTSSKLAPSTSWFWLWKSGKGTSTTDRNRSKAKLPWRFDFCIVRSLLIL